MKIPQKFVEHIGVNRSIRTSGFNGKHDVPGRRDVLLRFREIVTQKLIEKRLSRRAHFISSKLIACCLNVVGSNGFVKKREAPRSRAAFRLSSSYFVVRTMIGRPRYC